MEGDDEGSQVEEHTQKIPFHTEKNRKALGEKKRYGGKIKPRECKMLCKMYEIEFEKDQKWNFQEKARGQAERIKKVAWGDDNENSFRESRKWRKV